MNPIPTTKAMNPAPGKGITSFPTPVLNDVIVAEIVNAWKGDYQALEYGTKWDDVPHGSQQVSRPDHKLVFQTTISEDGQWVRRIWANDRVDQDTYNYAIKYSGGSPDHPIYIRTYVEPRDTYAPLPDNTPDPVYPSALLVEEEVVRQQSELDSEYVQVVRVYETIPGPAITSKRVNERGDTETIVTQVVPPGTEPDPDGLLVTGTQVQQEDTSKGVKTTSTVESHSQLETKDKKDGLLGETTTTENIVDPSTTPDTLSTSVIASTVQQISATKAVKRTTTLNGPASLTQKSKDGKLLGDITATESIVAPGTSPDAVSNTILSSEVRQTDSGKAIKRNVVLNSTPTLLGSETKPGLLGETSVTQSIVNSGTQADALTLNIVSSSVEPIDSERSQKTTITSSGPTQLLAKENKGGLLGETTITRSIVESNAEPDPLSLSVIESSINQIDSAKSEKITVTSTGPTSLVGERKGEGLLGEVTIKEEIVPIGTEPSPLDFTTVSSEVIPIDSTKARKVTISSFGPTTLFEDTLVDSPAGLIKASGGTSIQQVGTGFTDGSLYTLKNSTQRIDETKYKREFLRVSRWPELEGVEYDEVLGIPIKYTEKVVSPNEYKNLPSWVDISNRNYKPIDEWKTLRRTYDKEGIVQALTEQYYAIETQAQITLPDKLLGATIYWSLDAGKAFGSGSNPTVGGDSYSYTQSYSQRSSANVTGDIYFKVEKGFSGAIPATEHIFFMPISEDGTVTGSVLDALNLKSGNAETEKKWSWEKREYITIIVTSPEAYQKWPNIKRVTENIVIVSGSKSETFSSTSGESVSINGFSKLNRSDTSYDIDRNANTVTVPDTIHGQIIINSSQIGDFGGVGFSPKYGIFPNILSPTNITQFPVGRYLISANMELYKWGLVKVTALTVDITEEYV